MFKEYIFFKPSGLKSWIFKYYFQKNFWEYFWKSTIVLIVDFKRKLLKSLESFHRGFLKTNFVMKLPNFNRQSLRLWLKDHQGLGSGVLKNISYETLKDFYRFFFEILFTIYKEYFQVLVVGIFSIFLEYLFLRALVWDFHSLFL